jgi:TatD DNase family protein
MQLVDSHCHLDQLDLTPYQGDLSKALMHAENLGVMHFLCVCITLKDFPTMLKTVAPFKNVSVSLGIHPTEQITEEEPTVEELVRLAKTDKVIAIGETGLDYYRIKEDLTWQQLRFRRHIQAGIQLNLPIIVHTRQAQTDTIAILREENAAKVGGIMHCFTEDWSMARQALDLGFYISISGIVTFKNATVIQDVAKKVPLDRLLIETDSPYLAPVPHRGKSNEPAYVRYVAEYIATLRGMDPTALAQCTTDNFFTLFNSLR